MEETIHIIIRYGINVLQALALAVVAGLFNREAKKHKAECEKTDRRAAIRAEESRLSMQLMSANAMLSYANGMAIKEHKENRKNGEIDLALRKCEAALNAYNAFIGDVASKQMTTD